MLKTLGASALKDIIGMLKQEADFFSKDESGRRAILDKLLPAYPAALTVYLYNVDESGFLSDLKGFFQVLDGFSMDENSGFLKALMDYVSRDLGSVLDTLDMEFFFLDYSKREARLMDIFPHGSFLNSALVDYFIQSTYQELTEASYQAINQIQDIPTIVLQSPLELSSNQRQEMRTAFLERYPNSFAEFQVNTLLIGGLRVFVEGDVVDHSWLGKVQALTAL